ncbi:uncharacterized protein GVI51_G04433 [Nakaseomyces glabratus]|uniref:ADIPOR-like receptor IZH1 n=2 Tax=Candida glabrata TaxID=5478 RepID=Q6FT83_CANGA|nr:uncharacterized protein CAGL0G04631g [Nakaseomyces glabratus]KAH7586863.1 hemolysin-III related [Nakaseomyces glabratus]KAH7588862.1 hemolysin-III related [Nakaseomyces glabratus]KAH7593276.1 hemolysin-III related [Nakaseomyces glabratus]KAH7602313.1 hemolysin-III related [Nakaseomyces glabratus]KAH7603313.1 hemolysin-III related [Nakaseomyces glabratus]|eukprot:XP_446561.1 uncharacterized protein CAGL0G04631g [[Candida] glabrata]
MSATTTLRKRASKSVGESGGRNDGSIHAHGEEKSEKLLWHFNELPEWQKDNDKILRGYVRETNSFKRCLQSLLYLNNESVNIYTHLIPAVFYISLSLYLANVFLIPVYPSTSSVDYVIINVFFLGAFFCLLCSSCFHCMKQHSESQCNVWSKLDYLGIICLISCSTVPMIYYGYFDHISEFTIFTGITLLLAIGCSVFVLTDKFNTTEYRPIRASFFTLFGFSGIIPLGAGFLKFGAEGVLQRISLPFIGLEALFYISGAIIYGFRFPETIAPGKFDFFGSSHQIFHIMVVLGSICHLFAMVESYHLIHSNFLRPV